MGLLVQAMVGRVALFLAHWCGHIVRAWPCDRDVLLSLQETVKPVYLEDRKSVSSPLPTTVGEASIIFSGIKLNVGRWGRTSRAIAWPSGCHPKTLRQIIYDRPFRGSWHTPYSVLISGTAIIEVSIDCCCVHTQVGIVTWYMDEVKIWTPRPGKPGAASLAALGQLF